MAWETSGKRQYYYRKHRHGLRVTSEYVGIGLIADLSSSLDHIERLKRSQAMKEIQLQRWQEKMIDKELDQVCEYIRVLNRALFLINGYHAHKGQWRKKRHE